MLSVRTICQFVRSNDSGGVPGWKVNDIVIFPGMQGEPLPGGARVCFLSGCQVEERLASVSQSWNVMGCRASCNKVRVCIVRMDCILWLNRKRLES